MPLNYTNFFFNLLSVLIVQLQEKTIWWNITEYNISEVCIRVTRPFIVYFIVLNIDYSTCFSKLCKGLNHPGFTLLRQFTIFNSILLRFNYTSWKGLFFHILPYHIFCYITWVNLFSSCTRVNRKFYRMTFSLISTFLRRLAKLLLWPFKNIFTISSFY